MTLDDLKSNIEKTRKITAYAIKTSLGRDYDVQVHKLDWDWSTKEGNAILFTVMFIVEISYENYGYMEVQEINSFLTEQERAIYKVLDSQKSTIGIDGLFGPRNEEYLIIGPNVDGIDFNADFFKTRWIVEITPKP